MLTKEFESFLDQITRNFNEKDEKFLLLDIGKFFTGKAERNLPDCKIAIPKDVLIDINSFKKKLNKILISKDHIVTNRILEVFIAIFLLVKEHSKKELKNIEIFNNIISSIESIKLNQYIFLPYPKTTEDGTFNFDFFDFEIGNTNFDKLKYKTERLGSDVYESYIKKNKSNISIERKTINIKALSVYDIRTKSLINNINDHLLFNYLIEDYFYNISEILNLKFIDDFEKQQDLYYALTTFRLDPNFITHSNLGLNIFFDFKNTKLGWCTPSGTVRTINLDYKMPWKENINFYKNYFIDNQIKTKKNWKLIENFSYFMRIGMEAPKTNKLNPQLGSGYIHFLVSLELIFGNFYDLLIERLATLETLSKKDNYADNYKKVKHLIGKRGLYIHKGEEIHSKDFIELELICRSVLIWLVNLNKYNDTFEIKEICKKIDAINALIKTKTPIHDTLINDLCINFSVKEDYPNKFN
jgi:hypothetical protein